MRYRYGVFFLAAIVSVLLHILTVIELEPSIRPTTSRIPKQKPVKITLVDKLKKVEKPKEKQKDPDDFLKKLLETPLDKTEAPDKATHSGVVDHKTAKESRLKDIPQEHRAKDAGQGARSQSQKQLGVINGEPLASKAPKNLQKDSKKIKPKQDYKTNPASKALEMKTQSQGKVAVTKPRNSYEALLPQGHDESHEQMQSGYREYVDQSIAEGDKIDINTSEYRYIGYFSTMRKAIELVWNYPKEAARKGLQGEVGLEFAIEKDGRASQVKVLKSSGYELLDRAIVEAINLASPFSPLPDGFGKKKIVVTGSFRYVLYGYNVN
jgi:TonB family protein